MVVAKREELREEGARNRKVKGQVDCGGGGGGGSMFESRFSLR